MKREDGLSPIGYKCKLKDYKMGKVVEKERIYD